MVPGRSEFFYCRDIKIIVRMLQIMKEKKSTDDCVELEPIA